MSKAFPGRDRCYSAAMALRWVTGFASLSLLVSCNGTAVFDRPDPNACDTGHGCPSVICSCGDGSRFLETTCESGQCQDSAKFCDDRCAEFEGVASVVESTDDVLAMPACNAFCLRIRVNGCDQGCEAVTSECVASDDTCAEATTRFWRCMTENATMECDEGVLRMRGCSDEIPAFCETPKATE
jgi:hypothetical protein